MRVGLFIIYSEGYYMSETYNTLDTMKFNNGSFVVTLKHALADG